MNEWQSYMDWFNQSPYFQYVMDAARESAGLNRFEIESKVDIANRTLDQSAKASQNSLSTQRAIAEMQSRNQLQIAQGQQQLGYAGLDLQKQIAEGNLALDRDKLGLAREDLTARIQYQNAQLANDRERIAIEQGQAAADKWYKEQQVELAKGGLGLQYLEAAAKLGGPADYFQFLDFAGGARTNPELPNWLDALNRNAQQEGFGGTNTAQGTTPQTMDSLTAALSGGAKTSAMGGITSVNDANAGTAGTGGATSASPTDTNRALQVIGQVGLNPAGLAPQTLESLSPDERDVMFSGLKKLGFSPSQVVSDYGDSRIYQGSSTAA